MVLPVFGRQIRQYKHPQAAKQVWTLLVLYRFFPAAPRRGLILKAEESLKSLPPVCRGESRVHSSTIVPRDHWLRYIVLGGE